MSAAARAHQRALGRVTVTRQARTALLWGLGLTLLLPQTRLTSTLGAPLLWLSTVAHELGHGLTAIALGGTLERFVIRLDGSGTAYTTTDGSDLAQALVSAGGLVGPAIVAAVFFVLARRAPLARLTLALFGAALISAAVLVADPGLTRGYLGAVGGLSLAAACFTPAAWAQVVLVFLALQLAVSVFTRGDYLFSNFAVSGEQVMESDVAQMAAHLGGPYWAWGLACGLVSVIVLALGVLWYLRGDTRVALGDLRARS